MYFKIQHFSVATQLTFEAVTDKVGACGPILYTISGDYPDGTVTLDEMSRTVSLYTETGHDLGIFQVEISAELLNYPLLTQELGITMTFEVTIDSDCLLTQLVSTDVGDTFYMIGETATVEHILVRDVVSGWAQQDGYTLCGPRVFYMISEPQSGKTIEQEAYIGEFTMYEEEISDPVRTDVVILVVGLAEYPNIITPIQI